MHEDVENEQTIETLAAIVAGSDHTFNLEGRSIQEVMLWESEEDPDGSPSNMDVHAVARYFRESPNGKMTRYICEDLGARLSRLQVFYPPHNQGRISRKRPKLVLDLEPWSETCMPRTTELRLDSLSPYVEPTGFMHRPLEPLPVSYK